MPSAIPGLNYLQTRYQQKLDAAPRAKWADRGKASSKMTAVVTLGLMAKAGIGQLCAGLVQPMLQIPALVLYRRLNPQDESGSNVTYAGNSTGPTASPVWGNLSSSAPPTLSPTLVAILNSPTPGPAWSPVWSPTGAPSFSPSYSPTYSPTDTPTHAPTHVPTESPTESPTPHPTAQNSTANATQTTGSPTTHPTSAPTAADDDAYLPNVEPVLAAAIAIGAICGLHDQVRIHAAVKDVLSLALKLVRQRLGYGSNRPVPESVTRLATLGVSGVTAGGLHRLVGMAAYTDPRVLIAGEVSLLRGRIARGIARDGVQDIFLGGIPKLEVTQPGGAPLNATQKKKFDLIHLPIRIVIYGACIAAILTKLETLMRDELGSSEDELATDTLLAMAASQGPIYLWAAVEALMEAVGIYAKLFAAGVLNLEMHYYTTDARVHDNLLERVESARANGAMRALGGVFAGDLRLGGYEGDMWAQLFLSTATEARGMVKAAGAKATHDAQRLQELTQIAVDQVGAAGAGVGDEEALTRVQALIAQKALELFELRGEDGRRSLPADPQQAAALVLAEFHEALKQPGPEGGGTGLQVGELSTSAETSSAAAVPSQSDAAAAVRV